MFISLLMSTVQTGNHQLTKMFLTPDLVVTILELCGVTATFYPSHAESSFVAEPVKHGSVTEFEELLMQEESKSQRLS